MLTVISVVGAIFAFFIVVIVHESGHFFVARLLGVKVMQFSIGFGKAIYSRTGKSGVLYAIRLLPLGGYVQMADGALSAEDLEKKGSAGAPFHTRPLLVRIAVVIAGPVINILLAIVLYWLLFMSGVTVLKPIVGSVIPNTPAATAGILQNDQIKQVGGWETHSWQAVLMSFVMHVGDQDPLPVQVVSGKDHRVVTKQILLSNWRLETNNPDMLKGIGLAPKYPLIKPVVNTVMSDSPAKGLLLPGDVIVQFNQQAVKDWPSLVGLIQTHPEQKVQLTVQRHQQLMRVPVTIVKRRYGGQEMGYLGVTPVFPKISSEFQSQLKYPFFGAWRAAFMQTWRLIDFHFVVVKQMIVGNISLKTLGGPITIFQSAGIASKAGFEVYVGFLALISVVLGVLNILPVPGLDGGHLLLCLVEGVIRRPLPAAVQNILGAVGIGFLVMLMVYATLNDLQRLFS